MAAVRLMPTVLRSFQSCTRKFDEPYRLASRALESVFPVLSLSLHTSSSYHASRKSGSGRNRGHGGSGKRNNKDGLIHCPSCNSPFTEVSQFEGHPRFLRCMECHYFFLKANEIPKSTPAPKEEALLSPKELKTFLDKYVVGQELAKIILSTSVYHHYKRVRHNLPNQKSTSMAAETSLSEISMSTPLFHSREELLELSKDSGKMSALGPRASMSKPHEIFTFESQTDKNKVVIEKSNILMLGSTGSGKTLLAQTLARILDVPFAICDCTTLTSAGYVGEDIESVIGKLLQQANGDVDKCQQGIVFLDEIDKIAKAQNTQHLKDVGGEGVQQGMLKMLEGTQVNVPEKNRKMRGDTVVVDTTNILFVAAGAFSGLDKIVQRRKNVKYLGFGAPMTVVPEEKSSTLYENQDNKNEFDNQLHDELMKQVEDCDLIEFGLIPEFVGRMPKLCPFHSLDEDILVKILTEPKNSLLKQFKHSFLLDKCELDITPEALRAIAQVAMKKKMGARGLRAEVERHLLTAMYEVPGSDIKRVVVNEDVIRNNTPPTFVHGLDPEDLEYESDSTNFDIQETNIDNLKDSSPKVL
ncbi:ATP-dependent Clp protease ATP-binding subunit ClpX-like [Mercenaria mercenaria]|uniref:ATP-dependent Clp protease ATP-binding subunit ClpX-like n=1 Tax=Mercenaria mercenaria TaxID=6596 RepID=UPI00234E5CF3|nr:ATP-dependent Clp protease ATP-binding subunit ClpX-like [Mercenaria mercenaria]